MRIRYSRRPDPNTIVEESQLHTSARATADDHAWGCRDPCPPRCASAASRHQSLHQISPCSSHALCIRWRLPCNLNFFYFLRQPPLPILELFPRWSECEFAGSRHTHGTVKSGELRIVPCLIPVRAMSDMKWRAIGAWRAWEMSRRSKSSRALRARCNIRALLRAVVTS